MKYNYNFYNRIDHYLSEVEVNKSPFLFVIEQEEQLEYRPDLIFLLIYFHHFLGIFINS